MNELYLYKKGYHHKKDEILLLRKRIEELEAEVKSLKGKVLWHQVGENGLRTSLESIFREYEEAESLLLKLRNIVCLKKAQGMIDEFLKAHDPWGKYE